MKTQQLTDVLERIESWPAEAQDQLAVFALEIEAELAGDFYQATPEELAAIDHGLASAERGNFADRADVARVLANFGKR